MEKTYCRGISLFVGEIICSPTGSRKGECGIKASQKREKLGGNGL